MLASPQSLNAEPTPLVSTARWTFITNHGLVLSYLFHSPRSTAREIANHIGVTEWTTHKIISDLESEGYIQRRRDGRRNVYRVDPSLPLRHHTQQETMVSDLLSVLSRAPAPARDEMLQTSPL